MIETNACVFYFLPLNISAAGSVSMFHQKKKIGKALKVNIFAAGREATEPTI